MVQFCIINDNNYKRLTSFFNCAINEANNKREALILGRKLPNISESEWLIMNKLWEKSPLTAAEIVEKIQREKDLKITTIKTLLRRLIAKKAVSFTIDPKNSKLYYYSPIVEQQDCILKESRQFLSLYYENDLNKLFANFLEDTKLSDQEIEALKKILEQKKGEAND